jgi:hypothetical protein
MTNHKKNKPISGHLGGAVNKDLLTAVVQKKTRFHHQEGSIQYGHPFHPYILRPR